MSNALSALKRLLTAIEKGSQPSAADVATLKRAVQAIESGDRYTPGKEFGRGVGRPRKDRTYSDEIALALQRVRELEDSGLSHKEAVDWLTLPTHRLPAHLKRKGPRELSMSGGTLERLILEDRRRTRAAILREIDSGECPRPD